MHISSYAASRQKIVIGTTATVRRKDTDCRAAKDVAIVLAPNMSVGVNLALKLLEMTAKIMVTIPISK